MNWTAFWVITASAIITALRLIIPTVAHSWPMVFIALTHIWLGVMFVLLWQARGRWLLGWLGIGVPTVLEGLMFFHLLGF